MKLHKSIVISIITIVLSSCGSVSNSAGRSALPTPDIGIEFSNQKYLEVTAPDGWNSFKTNKSVSLLIRNISDAQIVAEPDFGARIFAQADNEWIEVPNKIVYPSKSPFVLDPNKNFDATKTVSFVVKPDLPDNSISSEIRVFIVGTLIQNGQESNKVASFIELRLTP
jgi:hypothetical protein